MNPNANPYVPYDASQREAARQQIIAARKAEAANVFPLGRVLLLGSLAIATVGGLLGEMQETVPDTEAQTRIVGIVDHGAVRLFEGMDKVARGVAEDDERGNLGPVDINPNNPLAVRLGIFNRNVELLLNDGSLRYEAQYDDVIGFHVALDIVGSDGSSKPIAINEDTIHVTTDKAQPCEIGYDNDFNSWQLPEYCTPLESDESRGVVHSAGYQGPWWADNNNITRDASIALETARDSTWCDLGLIFGSGNPRGPISFARDADSGEILIGEDGEPIIQIHNVDASGRHSVDGASTYQGLKDATTAALRLEVAMQLGLPFTAPNGMPYVLTLDDKELLVEVSRLAEKPIYEMSAEEYVRLVDAAEFSKINSPNAPTFDPGDPAGLQLLNLMEENSRVRAPSKVSVDGQLESLSMENYWLDSQNFECLPYDNPDAIRVLERDSLLRLALGRLAYAEPNLKLSSPAPSEFGGLTASEFEAEILDPSQNEFMITEYMVRNGMEIPERYAAILRERERLAEQGIDPNNATIPEQSDSSGPETSIESGPDVTLEGLTNGG